MTETKELHSRLDPFFYFKRGYTQYMNYLFGIIEQGNVILLSLALIFGVPREIALIIILVAVVPVAVITMKVGIWDMKKGGKQIDVRLHYQNDPLFMGVIQGVYLMAKEKNPEWAETFKDEMIRYGVFHVQDDHLIIDK